MTSQLDLFSQDILDVLSQPRFVKVRLYLLRGLNLTAQADVNSAMNRFAGYSAFSSANAFPQIVVGDGDNDHQNGGLTRHSEVHQGLAELRAQHAQPRVLPLLRAGRGAAAGLALYAVAARPPPSLPGLSHWAHRNRH